MARHSDRMEHLRNDMLSYLADIIRQECIEFSGMDPDKAELLGYSVADRMAAAWGGQNFTFPKDAGYKAHKLHWEMYNDFRGNNYSEVALKHGVSERWVRKVVAKLGKIDLHERQSDIFSSHSTE
jgi:Mor family transcriptional regulator